MLAVLAAADALDAATAQLAAREAGEGSSSGGASTKPTTAARAWALAACPWLLRLQQGQSALVAMLTALEGPLLVSCVRGALMPQPRQRLRGCHMGSLLCPSGCWVPE